MTTSPVPSRSAPAEAAQTLSADPPDLLSRVTPAQVRDDIMAYQKHPSVWRNAHYGLQMGQKRLARLGHGLLG